MAKIHEEVIIITVSKLVKNDEKPESILLTDDIGSALEQVAQELLGNDVVVEVNKA